jgi:hypothetical protein
MTNILDVVSGVLSGLNLSELKKGFMPPDPDTCIGLFEYPASPPEHSFGGTNFVHGVQVRIRSLDAGAAYANAEVIAETLNHYQDKQISIQQSTAVLDIGRDNSNPARQEYTVNFTVRRL